MEEVSPNSQSMAVAKRESPQTQAIDLVAKPAERPQPRITQIIKQFPMRRGSRAAVTAQGSQGGEQELAKKPEDDQAPPIHDLEPLLILNKYRRSLGLGPSRNLISSRLISDSDPNAVARTYERLAMSRPPWLANYFAGFPTAVSFEPPRAPSRGAISSNSNSTTNTDKNDNTDTNSNASTNSSTPSPPSSEKSGGDSPLLLEM